MRAYNDEMNRTAFGKLRRVPCERSKIENHLMVDFLRAVLDGISGRLLAVRTPGAAATAHVFGHMFRDVLYD